MYVFSSSSYAAGVVVRIRADSGLTHAIPTMSLPAIGARTIVQCCTPVVVCRISSPPGHAHPLLAVLHVQILDRRGPPAPPIPRTPAQEHADPDRHGHDQRHDHREERRDQT